LSFLVIGVVLVTTEFPALSAEKDGRKAEMKRLLPLKVEDYKADGKDELYDRNTAFRYMDGAAELYRSYAFKLLLVRRYLKAGHPSLLVELFDMGSSEDAFGIFSYQIEEEEVGIGQGSDYGGGLLRFWKGNYFANVFAERETPATRKDILTLGEAIAKNIKKEGSKPKLIQFLPEEGLSQGTIHYFHLHQVLNHHYFISHENILNLGARTNAILATYPSPGEKGKTFLLLIQYPDQKQAEKAFQSFLKAYMPEAPSSKTVKTENGKWTSAKIHRQYILVVFDAPSVEKTEELIRAVVKKLPGK
ncbi:MAG: hypothetical protein Q7U55_04825, partial [Deltaproteobacteria bacterium]|nr:hypothetical protein [Deltaproteobacteria bacterium]